MSLSEFGKPILTTATGVLVAVVVIHALGLVGNTIMPAKDAEAGTGKPPCKCEEHN